jgi:hypothetical protein
MSIDLQDLFNEEGLSAPPLNLDTDYVIRRGRRVRVRRRAAVGTTAFVGAGVVAVGTVALVGSSPFAGHAQPLTGVAAASGGGIQTSLTPPDASTPPAVSSSTASPSADSAATPPPVGYAPSGAPTPTGTGVGAPQGAPPADLAAVSLPNPAPGFPLRRWADDVSPETSGPGKPDRWVATFGLAVQPEPTSTRTPGMPSGVPNGPEVTIFVGAYSTPVHLSGLGSRALAGAPTVAGVTGHLAEYTEKGTTFSVLYFTTGKFTTEIIGNNVTTEQLIALGDALTGLQ